MDVEVLRCFGRGSKKNSVIKEEKEEKYQRFKNEISVPGMKRK